ncbi:DUF2141 domain-containing protein [Thalassotalea sediminis]|uniref:DUF2141 domain-containing protein n=1 Tax=Thalassotalea sediminis TaxID=1759089 RepID=UPI002573B62E|nr:DUF2141 domain-containing protein [Thalassotalea sediminis]
MYKHLLLSTILTLQTPVLDAKQVTIEVNNIDISKKGNVIVMIFGESGFPKDHQQTLAKQTQRVQRTKQTFTFTISAKEFAVKVLHDENQDGKVTKNWTGIYPKDGLGFTNKQRVGLTGPPSFQKSRILLSEVDSNLAIDIVYP